LETIQEFLDNIYKEYYLIPFRGGHVIRGKLRAMTDFAVAAVKTRTESLGWLTRFEHIDGVEYLNCTVLETPAKRRTALHAGLFIVAVFTTMIGGGDLGFARFYQIFSFMIVSMANAAGGLFTGNLDTAYTWLLRAGDGLAAIAAIMREGIPFSFAILTILGCHEMGHYLMARRHAANATLPFFIPVPLGIGTLGAIIKIKSPLTHRRTVMDVGAAGPLSGAVPSLVFLVIGLLMSSVEPIPAASHMPIFGNSLLTRGLIYLMFGPLEPGHDVMLHSFAFAGFLGLLITAVNLLPIGQLDGGHVAFALFGKGQAKLAKAAFGLLITLGVLGLFSDLGLLPAGIYAFWPWLLFVLFVRSFMRTSHPPTLDDSVKLDPIRKLVGILCIVILIVCFVPVPVR